MAQWAKAPAANPNDLSFIPETHMAEVDHQLLQLAL